MHEKIFSDQYKKNAFPMVKSNVGRARRSMAVRFEERSNSGWLGASKKHTQADLEVPQGNHHIQPTHTSTADLRTQLPPMATATIIVLFRQMNMRTNHGHKFYFMREYFLFSLF